MARAYARKRPVESPRLQTKAADAAPFRRARLRLVVEVSDNLSRRTALTTQRTSRHSYGGLPGVFVVSARTRDDVPVRRSVRFRWHHVGSREAASVTDALSADGSTRTSLRERPSLISHRARREARHRGALNRPTRATSSGSAKPRSLDARNRVYAGAVPAPARAEVGISTARSGLRRQRLPPRVRWALV